MHKELTNLIPPERAHTLRRDYLIRLLVVVFVCAALLITSACVLLVPTYLFIIKSVGAKETHLANINSTLSLSDESALSAQLGILSDNAATLTALADVPSASSVIREVLAVVHPGVVLTSINYSSATGKNPGRLTVSGSAATRETLRTYQLALQNSLFARSADVPVSAYAKDADIAFTITVILAP